ncbi:hypothetical protein HPP92_003002 [Vanilla planifolia]|uniref:TBCC domain-containing protein 1 n=1 Tax=Vanilla planifolia TaxID=51239 RepID=A0A835VJ05_VANPL|nr:hypothetical protein HPP92_003002 [Vanilla planifolia]
MIEEPSTSFSPLSTATATATATAGDGVAPLLLRPRREPFEHGLLPIPKLIFADGTLTLGPLKQRLLRLPFGRVDTAALADVLQISTEHARLAIDTLSAVLHCEPHPAGVDVHDLILFLYLQSYKRLVPKGHKDSSAVADVWPSTSAFDGYLSALTPLQLVRSNTRRFMPSQADEEAHQLSYLQKHLANIISLLSESPDGMDDESLVLTMEIFDHLGFLVQFEKGVELVPLSQAAPFFANSDPDMPAAPVSAAQVHEWISQNIVISLENNAEKVMAKENGHSNALDADVTMTDASLCHSRSQSGVSPNGSSMQNSPWNSRNQTFVEGISKASLVKQPCDIKGNSVKVLNCHDSVIYLLAPLKYAIVYGCSDATVILGAIGKAVRVEHCERVQVIAASKRICIANCRECVFYLGVNQQPLILGDNHKLQVAPFNTYYPQMEEHLAHAGIESSINKWNEPLVLGLVDPHDSLSHPAGVFDTQSEPATCLDPEQFTEFLIPRWFAADSSQITRFNPFTLPDAYVASQRNKHLLLADIQKGLRDLQIDESKRRELACVLHVHFKEWLYASGNIRQLYCLQGD